jgi:hypothetical protein
MEIQYAAIVAYLLVGIMLSYYWFVRDYEKEYKKSIEDGETEERGMFSLVMLLMTVLWPFILIKNLIIHKTL